MHPREHPWMHPRCPGRDGRDGLEVGKVCRIVRRPDHFLGDGGKVVILELHVHQPAALHRDRAFAAAADIGRRDQVKGLGAWLGLGFTQCKQERVCGGCALYSVAPVGKPQGS